MDALREVSLREVSLPSPRFSDLECSRSVPSGVVLSFYHSKIACAHAMLAAPHFFDEGPQQQATIAPSAVLTESPSRRHTQFSEFPMDSDPRAHRPLPPDSSGPAISGTVEGSRWIAQYAPPVPSSSSTMLPHPDPAFEPIAPPPASGSTAPLNLSPLATVSQLPGPRRASLTSPENITVGDYLTSFPNHPAPNPSPTRTLASPSRRNSDGGFEAEVSADSPGCLEGRKGS